MNQSLPPNLSSLADFYASLGLFPSESELEAALATLRTVLANSVALDAVVPRETEPAPAFFPPNPETPS